MDAVDQSDHYNVRVEEETPSMLAVVIDTNPRAWAALEDQLTLSKAIANVLVFINAHLAFNGANQAAVIAAHVNKAAWLYPAPSRSAGRDNAGDVQMEDPQKAQPKGSAGKFPQFANLESAVVSSLQKLMAETTLMDLETTTSQISGALTLALCHLNKAGQALGTSQSTLGDGPNGPTTAPPPMKGRIVVISASDSEPSQYIPTMNAVFAAAHNQIAIDTMSLSGNSTFLQQACFNTNGIFLEVSHPKGLLSYLMFGLITDTEARNALITPTHDTVDFRAACFCHGKVVDTGFVCSICLSIFCEQPPDAICLTCGNKLLLGNYGAKPAVIPKKKKKKKRPVNGSGREETSSGTGTPLP